MGLWCRIVAGQVAGHVVPGTSVFANLEVHLGNHESSQEFLQQTNKAA